MKFDIEKTIRKIKKPWTPIDLVTFEDKVLRIALFKGGYHEHKHEYDEFFYVYKGKITVWTEKKSFDLSAGEGGVVSKGVKHKPIAKVASYVLMIDPLENA